jgi:superfamily II DNA or RNA helicase
MASHNAGSVVLGSICNVAMPNKADTLESAKTYSEFVSHKLSTVSLTGLSSIPSLDDMDLMPHQRDLVRWALRRGRCAIFADTGLGKTRMQLAWASEVHKATGHSVLILAPLAVAAQTVIEGDAIGVTVTHCREAKDVLPGINITNYDRMHKFDAGEFGAVVLDESSCIKHHDTKTLAQLLIAFAETPFKLCATATPAPNDWTELGTHAEFLGICSRSEMLAEYFVHDGGETQVWRLKGHARAQFWKWVSSWGAMVRKPSDLGHDDTAYNLPPLTVAEHLVHTDGNTAGMLFAFEAQTLSERRDARRASMDDRVSECALKVKESWHKLAEHNEDFCHVVETAIRGKPKSTRSGKSNAPGKAPVVSQDEPGTKQGDQEGIHEGVLRGEPGKVQTHNAGAEGGAQRETQSKVRDGREVEKLAQGISEGLAGIKPGEAEVSAASEVRSDCGSIQRNDDRAEKQMRDMRTLGEETQDVPDGGSLPREREGSRDSVLELQHGDRKVHGQYSVAEVCNRLSTEQWMIWCDLNVEQDALEMEFGDLAFSIRGSDSNEEKESRLNRWMQGERPVMISKCSIMGWGINMQCCRNVAFVGVTDSFEAYYQAVRRCWRFGQAREVMVHIFASQLEGAVLANLKRKEAAALAMGEQLSAETRDAVREEVAGSERKTNPYNARTRIAAPSWLITEQAT